MNEPSSVIVSLNLSRKDQGTLYMKALKQAKRIKELEAAQNKLIDALQMAKHAFAWGQQPEHFDQICEALESVGVKP